MLHTALALLGVDISSRVWQARILAMFSNFEKILAVLLAANILIVYFVVCTLAEKKNQGRFRHVGSGH
jgi:hypothetical protein